MTTEVSEQLMTAFSSLADVACTFGAVTPLGTSGQLTPGPRGFLISAHPSNGGCIIRVSGSDVTTTKGQALAAGGSFVCGVNDIALLSATPESGSGSLQVSRA